ncbi:Defal1 [Phodopus roborovskii]|uniref:Defal1 protein n=1 Tax=Phodopus roborovskii TaxID=109678 RepID=A0AAU9Z554_PHORO|nr:Defal1 [Phodopus roborovskii]
MKTLFLLSALVLLAFQALADPLPEATEEAKTEAQPGVEDQAVSITFGGLELSALHRSESCGELCDSGRCLLWSSRTFTV